MVRGTDAKLWGVRCVLCGRLPSRRRQGREGGRADRLVGGAVGGCGTRTNHKNDLLGDGIEENACHH